MSKGWKYPPRSRNVLWHLQQTLAIRKHLNQKEGGKVDKWKEGITRIISTFARYIIDNCRVNKFGLYEIYVTEKMLRSAINRKGDIITKRGIKALNWWQFWK